MGAISYRSVRIVTRVVGTLIGLVGLGGLFFLPMILVQELRTGTCRMVAFLTFPLILNGYFIYVAYLVWFKFSPLAVRHVFASLGIYLFGRFTPIFFWEPFWYKPESWHPITSVGCLIAIYLADRLVSYGVRRLPFPESRISHQTGSD